MAKDTVFTADTKISLRQDNPKKAGARLRYEKYKKAKTVAEFYALGGATGDLRYDFGKGFLTIVGADAASANSAAKSGNFKIAPKSAASKASVASSSSSSKPASSASSSSAKPSPAAAAQKTATSKAGAKRKATAVPLRSVKRAKVLAGKAVATDPDAANTSTSSKSQNEPKDSKASKGSGKGKGKTKKITKILKPKFTLSDDEIGFRRFRVHERKRLSMYDDPRKKWKEASDEVRKRYIKLGKERREKEWERARIAKERGPAFSSFSTQLVLQRKKFRVKDMPTMRMALSSWKFPDKNALPKLCTQPSTQARPDGGITVVNMIAPQADPKVMVKGANMTLSRLHQQTRDAKVQLSSGLMAMVTELERMSGHFTPHSAGMVNQLRGIFGHQKKEDDMRYCKQFFDHTEEYPQQLVSLIPTNCQPDTLYQKRLGMDKKLRTYITQLRTAATMAMRSEHHNWGMNNAHRSGSQNGVCDDPKKILESIDLSPTPLPPESSDWSVKERKAHDDKMKMKTYRKGLEQANNAATQLGNLYEQRCTLWLRLLKSGAEHVDKNMWEQYRIFQPYPVPTLANHLAGSLRGSGTVQEQGNEQRDMFATSPDILRAMAGIEPSALFAAIAGTEEAEMPWQEVSADAMPVKTETDTAIKDIEACMALWSTIDKEVTGPSCTGDYMNWLKNGQAKDGECHPFIGAGGRWWFCENCKAWEKWDMQRYHARCAVRGGKPAIFSHRSGEGFSNTLHFSPSDDGETTNLQLMTNFNSILSQLNWVAYWPADQTQAFFRLVQHTLPQAPEGIKIEPPKVPAEKKQPKAKRQYHPFADPYDSMDSDEYDSMDSDEDGWGNNLHMNLMYGGPPGYGSPGGPNRLHRSPQNGKRKSSSGAGSSSDPASLADLGPQFSMASCTDLQPVAQPVSFRLPLYPIQLRTLGWMKEREGSSLEYLSREVIRRRFMSTDVDIELRVDRHWKGVRGGIMADAVGYGKTACLIGLVHDGLSTPLPDALPLAEFTDLSKRFILTGATLIITPPNLFEQWLGEFKKFLHPEKFDSCRIIEIPHIHRLNKLSVEDIANADVVVVPYRFFFSGVYNRHFDETIQNTQKDGFYKLQADSNSKADRSKFEALRYGILRQYVSQLVKPPKDDVEARKTSVGQSLPVKVLESMAPTLEAFYWKRVVFDEFHEVLGIHEGRPYHALRQCYAKYHWGLTATPRLGKASDVADMASLLHISIPAHDVTEAQHFIDEWVRSSTWDTSTVPLENRIIHVQHTKQERLLYLHQRNQVINRTGGSTAHQEEMLLKLCSHYSPTGDLEDVGDVEGAQAAVCRRQSELHDQLEEKKALLEAYEKEFPFQKRRMEVAEQLYGLFMRMGLPSKSVDCRGADLTVHDAHRLGGDRSAAEMEKLVKEIEPHVPAENPEQTAEELQQQTNNFKPSAELTKIMKSLVKPAAVARRKDHEPKYEPNGHSLVFRVNTLERDIEKTGQQIKELEISIRFFENTFKLLEDDKGEGLECAICMDDEDLPKSITRCGHIFHDACIKMVIDEHKSCPTCRCQLARKDASLVQQVIDDKKAVTKVPQNEVVEAPKFGSKMAKIVETLRQVRAEEPGAKVIMFCQWERILKFIAGTLKELGEPAPLILKGAMLQRQAIIRDFLKSNKKEHGVLLLSLEQSPTGMNLVQCHHVFLIHPMHAQTKERAVAFELQAIGRVRRQGQEKKVIVHRFVTENTVEEEMTKRHQTHLDEAEVKASEEKAKKDKNKAGKKKPKSEKDGAQAASSASSSGSASNAKGSGAAALAAEGSAASSSSSSVQPASAMAGEAQGDAAGSTDVAPGESEVRQALASEAF